jgi:hypothetical protein
MWEGHVCGKEKSYSNARRPFRDVGRVEGNFETDRREIIRESLDLIELSLN